MRMLELN